MPAAEYNDLKQRAARLPERDRQRLSVYLIQLGRERATWKSETARTLKAMSAGQKISVEELRKRLKRG